MKEKVIVIRSAPIEILKQYISENKDSELTILIQKSVANKINNNKIKKIIINDGFIGPFSISRNILKEINKNKYSKVVILLNKTGRNSYFKIELLCLLLNVEKLEFYNEKGSVEIISKRELLRRYIKRFLIRIQMINLFIIKILILFIKRIYKKPQRKNILYLSNAGIDEAIVQAQSLTPMSFLAKKGYNIFYISPVQVDADFNFINYKIVNKILSEYNTLKITNIPYENNLFFYLIRYIISAAEILVNNKCKVVHCRNMMPTVVGLILKIFFRVKLIFDLRGLWFEERETIGILKPGAFNFKGYFNLYLMRIFYLATLKFSDEIYVITDGMKNYIIKKYNLINKKINVVPTCLNAQKYLDFEPENSLKEQLKDKIVFGYSGSLVIWQQVDKMLEFFKQIKQKIVNSFFIIMSMDNVDLIKESFKKLFNEKDYLILNVYYNNVPKYLKLFDFGILFRDKSDMNIIAYPTKISEYLICGAVPIVSDSLHEVINLLEKYDCVLGLRIENEIKLSDEFIEKIKLFKKDNSIKEKCQKIAKEFFDWELYISLYEKSYVF